MFSPKPSLCEVLAAPGRVVGGALRADTQPVIAVDATQPGTFDLRIPLNAWMSHSLHSSLYPLQLLTSLYCFLNDIPYDAMVEFTYRRGHLGSNGVGRAISFKSWRAGLYPAAVVSYVPDGGVSKVPCLHQPWSSSLRGGEARNFLCRCGCLACGSQAGGCGGSPGPSTVLPLWVSFSFHRVQVRKQRLLTQNMLACREDQSPDYSWTRTLRVLEGM